ncbi:unnamed protein product [Caenorhabditis bovis]|uniref:PHD-type domain-containing protein n=1 Tax=Caenorhabditis bovis TaxID=2654633 RepID=A0A8S1EPU2_9PELO|nr:unnamed protein product [Caenorhabditis bovis]
MDDRKKRLRYPYYDQQTGTAQRESQFAVRSIDHRYSSNDSNTVVQFATERWRRAKNIPPSDAVEMKMFLRDNPALEAAVNHSTPQIAQPEQQQSEYGSEAFTSTPKETRTRQAKEDYRDELMLDDDMSPDENGSDEDDWSSRKKRRGGATGSKSSNRKRVPPNRSSNRHQQSYQQQQRSPVLSPSASSKKSPANTSMEEKTHVCNKCTARYKSLAGLSYHLAYSHDMPSSHPTSKLLSPNIEISDFCDLCLGSAFMNKNTKQPEDLVTCHDCGRSGHPSCLSFNKNVTVIISRYGWQCIECKSCTICGTSENDDKLLFCDDCDRGYHLYCLKPALEKAPDDEYSCRLCQIEFGDKASAPLKK